MIGPLLFLLYVNDLPEVANNSTVALFADELQLDLDSMCRWSIYWSLKFNADKSFLLRISRKRNPSNYVYKIANAPISVTNSHKDLGVIVSHDLKWSIHIAHCTSKANRMLGFLRMNCFQMTNARCRRLLYIALVRSHLSYASEVWSPQSSGRDLALLEGVQRTQDYELPYHLRLKKLNLLPISYRLELKDLIFFFNCKQGNFDLDISQFVTFSSQRAFVSHSFKSGEFTSSYFLSYFSLQGFFFQSYCFLWNSLALSVRNISSVSSFKSNLYSHYFSKLDSTFDVNRMRTWKSFCSKCRSYNSNCCS